jgi:hypothetical protein
MPVSRARPAVAYRAPPENQLPFWRKLRHIATTLSGQMALVSPSNNGKGATMAYNTSSIAFMTLTNQADRPCRRAPKDACRTRSELNADTDATTMRTSRSGDIFRFTVVGAVSGQIKSQRHFTESPRPPAPAPMVEC